MAEEKKDVIVVLDFGGQYNQLIARRVRDAGVYCEMLHYDIPIKELREKKLKGIIFSGGPNSVYEEGAPRISEEIFQLGVPVLGICYGMQLMAQMLGGKVEPSELREYGRREYVIEEKSPLVEGVMLENTCWMSHTDQLTELPPGFVNLASTETTPHAAMANEEARLYGIQFHPEVRHTPEGQKLLENFLFEICHCTKNWSMDSYVEEQVAEIRSQVGSKEVLCGLSGGVDSAVAAMLVHRAVGEQLTCMFVDHGMLRKGERESVEETFKGKYGIRLVTIDAADRFLGKLKGVTDPEKKRKIIGEEFIRVFEEESARLGSFDFLVQGTLYSDVIESGTATAQTIKSHHNVGGLPEDFSFELIEPLKWLFKDEGRRLGLVLGLPESIVYRQPFPGPGLGIRILGEVTEEKLAILREADSIVRQEIEGYDHNREVWQYFAVLPNMRSVGVMGDARTYAYTIVVRAVGSSDEMTADWSRIPFEVLERISNRIVNEVSHVNRVAYDITSKPPGTIEWE